MPSLHFHRHQEKTRNRFAFGSKSYDYIARVWPNCRADSRSIAPYHACGLRRPAFTILVSRCRDRIGGTGRGRDNSDPVIDVMGRSSSTRFGFARCSRFVSSINRGRQLSASFAVHPLAACLNVISRFPILIG